MDRLKAPPFAPSFLQLVWGSRIARWLSEVDKEYDERWVLLRRWMDERNTQR